ncbi:MAG: protein kinase [Pseudomonadota bacterium]
MAEMDPALLEKLRLLAASYGAKRDYTVVKCAGSGGSAAVFQMHSVDNDIALKVYDPSFFEGDGGPAERRRIELQRKLIGHACESLVGVLQVDYEEETCFIQMSYIPWKDLSRELLNVPRNFIYTLLAQLAQAVRFLEGEGLVHRDIKPANIMVSPTWDQLILIDLGVVREWSREEDSTEGTDHGRKRPFIATNQYSSPEYLFRTHAPSEELWKALTWYQLGGVLHDLIARRPLFQDEVETGNRYAVALAVQQGMPNLDVMDDVPLHLKSLTLRCLTKDPKRRLRLVTWEDFAPPSVNPIQLAKRLSSLSVSQDRQHTVQQEKLQTAVSRSQMANELMGKVESALKENFADVLLEVVHPADGTTKYVIRWHFPPLQWAMDSSINVKWPSYEIVGGQAEVLLHTVLVKTHQRPQFVDGLLICATSEDAPNLDAIVGSLIETICLRLGEALSHLEQGEPQNMIELGD